MLALVYFAYSMVRLMADGSLAPAVGVAHTLLRIERVLGIDVEEGFNQIVASSQLLSLGSSFWYASAHFVVTAAVLLALYLRRPGYYAHLRFILVLATVFALVIYLAVPTAPPRLAGAPYIDVLAQTADHGWWGAQVSVPGGWGSHTNELAALPSMHAGWSIWVALVALWVPCRRVWKVAAVAYALTTAAVVIGTANHWTIDVLAGWAVVLLAAAVLRSRRTRAGDTAGAEDAMRLLETGPDALVETEPEAGVEVGVRPVARREVSPRPVR